MDTGAITILHVDMDAFYASVEQRDHPELRGRPVIVGGIEGRGVVCAASYEARPFGVHSAMAMAVARRLCPQAVELPVRMKHYAEVSRQIRQIFFSYTPTVEPLSLDEAFLDVAGCERLFGPAAEIARQIKSRIRAETALTASVGVAPNKFLAKLASDLCKPDGLSVVPGDGITAFLSPLPVSRLWGVGAKGQKRLHALGIDTIGELAAQPEQRVVDHLGEVGRHLWQLAHGLDDREVVPDREAKSVSTETTFAQDIGDREVLLTWLLDLVEHLAGRLRREQLWTKTVELKLRSSDFQTRSRSQTLAEATNSTMVLWQAAKELFGRSLTDDFLPLRLLGVGGSKLTRAPFTQGDLFDTEVAGRQSALDRTVDRIRSAFGEEAIRRGALVDRQPDDLNAADD